MKLRNNGGIISGSHSGAEDSSGMPLCVDREILPTFRRSIIAFIFRVEQSKKNSILGLLYPGNGTSTLIRNVGNCLPVDMA